MWFFLSIESAIGIEEPHCCVCGFGILILKKSNESEIGYFITTACLNSTEFIACHHSEYLLNWYT